MTVSEHFNTLIVITPKDCERLMPLYPRLIDNIRYGEVYFVGTHEVGDLVKSNPLIGDKVGSIDENDIIPFEDVHNCVKKRMERILAGRELPRGVTGWYYQQFLKMQYSRRCNDTYYMVWDGDTIPCREITMFQEESGKPYLDLKHEYHKEYFDTMARILPGFGKMIERSFISEHMLIRADIMRQLLDDIEKNDRIPGTRFWEKIINAIDEDKIQSSSFSEFETYGTYVALKYPSVYKLRDWHSFRQGGTFFSINTICDRDFEWLSKDFGAISFEKGHEVREDNKNLFDNPYYQEKLSPKQMLQAAQMEYKEGYKEVWTDDLMAGEANNHEGEFKTQEEQSLSDKKMTTKEILLSIKKLIEANPETISEIEFSEVVSCVYVELYGLRQLYNEVHFKELEEKLSRFSELLYDAKESSDAEMVLDVLNELFNFQNSLPDADVAQTFIERANYARALLRHREKNTVLVIGDSHVNFFSGNEELSFIPIGNDVNTCQQVNGLPLTVLHMGPALAYNSNRYGSHTKFREKLDWLREEFLQKGDRIICVLGEIDMRAHVFKEANSQNRLYQEIVDRIVENYCEFLLWLKNLGYEVYCYGPIASQKDSAPNTPDHPRVGSEQDRNRATEYFTNKMIAFCMENGIDFLTFFDEMITKDYETKEEFLSKDRFHLGQHGAGMLPKMLAQLGIIQY